MVIGSQHGIEAYFETHTLSLLEAISFAPLLLWAYLETHTLSLCEGGDFLLPPLMGWVHAEVFLVYSYISYQLIHHGALVFLSLKFSLQGG